MARRTKDKQMNSNSQIILNGIGTNELLEAVRNIVRSEVQALPQPEKIKPYLNIDEVCELLDLAKQTIYTMTHKKQIPFIRRGGKLLFSREEIKKWVEASAQPIIKN